MIATATPTVYMISTLAMGTMTYFAIIIIVLIAARLVYIPIRLFWKQVVTGLIKKQ